MLCATNVGNTALSIPATRSGTWSNSLAIILLFLPKQWRPALPPPPALIPVPVHNSDRPAAGRVTETCSIVENKRDHSKRMHWRSHTPILHLSFMDHHTPVLTSCVKTSAFGIARTLDKLATHILHEIDGRTMDLVVGPDLQQALTMGRWHMIRKPKG
jgi:hypothetical protein